MINSVTKKNNIDGILLLNKPYGLSSNTALQKVKRIFNAAKAGHTGTLDPLATGLLPICFGEATKFSSFLLDSNKEYFATIKLGQTTTTYDAEGDITASMKVNCTKSEILECMSFFCGQIMQIPPIYSALKVNGKALYEYARSNEEVLIKSRQIYIYELELLEHIEIDIIKIRVKCSKGTYIRSLAHDLGQKLGCGAHLIGLVRTKSAELKLDEHITFDYLGSLSLVELQQHLLPVDYMLMQYPIIELNLDTFLYIKNGHEFSSQNQLSSKIARLYYNGQFLGIANNDGKVIKPQRLINTTKLF